MAKIDYKKLRNELYKRTERYAESVQALYDKALSDISKEFAYVDYDINEPFSFEDVGKFDKIDAIMRRLEDQIQQVVEKCIVAEFGVAYNGCNELIKQVIGDRLRDNVEKAFSPRVGSGNAAKAFIRANRAGSITASQRVWNGAVLGQMETAVQEALMEGMPAKRMAALLEDYLVNPDDCFRRFRIKTGENANGKTMYGRQWKKRVIHKDGSTTWKNADPRNYPTGQGVYHSSYKNALRYARTTTNIAYRSAEYDRYQEFPFVIGIDIRLSNNPAHVKDICDELQGRYPKDFKWTGWHPNCMCYQVPVIATKSDVDDMVDEILDGGNPMDIECDGEVKELPPKFVDWIINNEDRYRNAAERGSIPYFLRDNMRYTNAGLNNAVSLDDVIGFQVLNFSQQERKSIIRDIRELRHSAHLFTDVDIHVSIEALNNGNMMTFDNGKLLISDVEFAFSDGETYCPARELHSAFQKLKNKKELNFYEEYAIESLFHESMHSRFNYTWGGNIDASINEICTQLYARENYPSILSTFGVDAVNQDDIRRNGLGYHDGCNHLRRYFTKDNEVDSQMLLTMLLSENKYESLIKLLTSLEVKPKEIKELLRNLL